MIVPVYTPLGVTVNAVEAALTEPDVGPVNVKVVAANAFEEIEKQSTRLKATERNLTMLKYFI